MSDTTTHESEPCDCGSPYCTGFRPKGPSRTIIPQHLDGECPDPELVRLREERDAFNATLMRIAQFVNTSDPYTMDRGVGHLFAEVSELRVIACVFARTDPWVTRTIRYKEESRPYCQHCGVYQDKNRHADVCPWARAQKEL